MLTIAIACGQLNPNVRKVVSQGYVTQKQPFLQEVSVAELAHGLALGCSGVCGLCITPLPTLHVEQVAHRVAI